MNLICGNTSEGMQRADLPVFMQILAATLPIGSGLWPFFALVTRVRSMHTGDTQKLVVQGITKVYRNGRRMLDVLQPIDMTVNNGEFVTLIGPSGCGKSTLFNIIAGVDEPSAGHIMLDGESGTVRAGKSGYMPQQPLLLPWRTVEENVLLGLDVRHVPRRQALDQAHELLKRFDTFRRNASARGPAAHCLVQCFLLTAG